MTKEEVPDLGPVPRRLAVDLVTVRRLVTEQFPPWSTLPIAPVQDGGWDTADFLVSLRGIDPTSGPRPGTHNWYRGGTLRTYDETTRSSLAGLVGHTDVDRAAEIWSAALAARWDGVDLWFHGDLSEGNLLLKDGQLAAVTTSARAAWVTRRATRRSPAPSTAVVDGPTRIATRGGRTWQGSVILVQ